MRMRVKALGMAGVAIAAAGFALSPAASAVSDLMRGERPVSLRHFDGLSTFTPTIRDSRLANAYARILKSNQGAFQFTPTSGSMTGRRTITIAVRADEGAQRSQDSSAASLGVTPVGYNLGVSRGWKRFALAENLGTRSAEPSVMEPIQAETFTLKAPQASRRFTTRVQQVDAGAALRPGAEVQKGALDVASSYALTRNLNVTAGVRYRGANSRLAPLTDDQQDSQAVYVGTSFKF